MSGMNKQLLQDLMQNIEARKQTEQRLKATVRNLMMWQEFRGLRRCSITIDIETRTHFNRILAMVLPDLCSNAWDSASPVRTDCGHLSAD
jgi:hypothetical protein